MRTGKHGEYEEKFLQTSHAYLTWRKFNHDLSKLAEKRELRELIHAAYPEFSTAKLSNLRGKSGPSLKV